MSFQGTTPLNNVSEFTVATTGNFGTLTVAGGSATASEAGVFDYNVALKVNASGAQTDNVFVAINVSAFSNGGGGLATAGAGFGIDLNSFVTGRAVPGSNTWELKYSNGSGINTVNPTFNVITPPLPSYGLPYNYALGIAGTVVTLYYRPSGSVWEACGTYDLAGLGFTTGTLATYSAFVQLEASNPGASITFDSLFWGPTSSLFGGTIPDVVGLDDATAQSDIVVAGFVVGTVTTTTNAAAPGLVVSQNPAAGTFASGGTAVDLVESLGLLVPDVTNTAESTVAAGLISAAGFTVGGVTYTPSGTIIAGNVISQSPAGGTYAAGGTPISLVVSSGLPALLVPDLFGLTQTDAINLLLSLGLVPGAIGSAPSKFVPPGEVQAQNPSAGAPVAVGTIVSFVLSLGIPAVGVEFDFEATVISQYANSPTIIQLVQNLNQYLDQSTNFANFFNFVWNVDTAVGFGLDIWGKIVGVSRLLNIPNTTDYVGFDNSATPPPDWQTMASSQPPYNDPPVGGAMYTGYNATTAYLLPDDAYRQLILAKAFANICTTTAAAINQILQNLYGPGTAWVLNTGPMAISYNLSFTPTAIQLAILEQSGVIPTPPGVSVVINTGV